MNRFVFSILVTSAAALHGCGNASFGGGSSKEKKDKAETGGVAAPDTPTATATKTAAETATTTETKTQTTTATTTETKTQTGTETSTQTEADPCAGTLTLQAANASLSQTFRDQLLAGTVVVQSKTWTAVGDPDDVHAIAFMTGTEAQAACVAKGLEIVYVDHMIPLAQAYATEIVDTPERAVAWGLYAGVLTPFDLATAQTAACTRALAICRSH